jgi:hypothetical protein
MIEAGRVIKCRGAPRRSKRTRVQPEIGYPTRLRTARLYLAVGLANEERSKALAKTRRQEGLSITFARMNSDTFIPDTLIQVQRAFERTNGFHADAELQARVQRRDAVREALDAGATSRQLGAALGLSHTRILQISKYRAPAHA